MNVEKILEDSKKLVDAKMCVKCNINGVHSIKEDGTIISSYDLELQHCNLCLDCCVQRMGVTH